MNQWFAKNSHMIGFEHCYGNYSTFKYSHLNNGILTHQNNFFFTAQSRRIFNNIKNKWSGQKLGSVESLKKSKKIRHWKNLVGKVCTKSHLTKPSFLKSVTLKLEPEDAFRYKSLLSYYNLL